MKYMFVSFLLLPGLNQRHWISRLNGWLLILNSRVAKSGKPFPVLRPTLVRRTPRNTNIFFHMFQEHWSGLWQIL